MAGSRIRLSGGKKPRELKVSVADVRGKFVDITHMIRNISIHGGVSNPAAYVVVLELTPAQVEMPEEIAAQIMAVQPEPKPAEKLKGGRPGSRRTKSGLIVPA